MFEMGTFPGHALPGSFFLVFGLWWLVNILCRYHGARKRNVNFKSTAIFNCPWLFWRLKYWPIEAYVKIIMCTIGIIAEIKAAFYKGKFAHFGDGQHATMYLYFGLSGIVDVLHHYKFSIPPNLDYVSLSMALACEGLLFKFHLHGRTDLDVLLHTLLLYVIAAGVVACLLEMQFRNSILAALLRSYSLLLQGSWFWQIGFILYSPIKDAKKWDENDHSQIILATMIFTWHAAAWFMVMLILCGIISCIQNRCSLHKEGDTMALQKLITTNTYSSDAQKLYEKLDSDSNSDTEFHKPV